MVLDDQIIHGLFEIHANVMSNNIQSIIHEKPTKLIMKYTVFRDIFINPKAAFSEIHNNSRDYFFIAIGILISESILINVLDISGIITLAWIGETPKSNTSDLFFQIELSIFFSVLTVGIIYLVAKKFFKTQTSFRGLFSTLQFAIFPYTIISIPVFLGITNYVSTIANNSAINSIWETYGLIVAAYLPLGIWSLILSVLACKQSLQIRTIDVIVTMIISGIIIAVIVGIITFTAPPNLSWFKGYFGV